MTAATMQRGGRSHEAVHRIVDRMRPVFVRGFVDRMAGVQADIDVGEVAARIQAGAGVDSIVSLVPMGRIATLQSIPPTFFARLEDAIRRAMTAAGIAAGNIVESAVGVDFAFRATDPEVILFARRRGARLVGHVADDVKKGIASVIAAGAEFGITPQVQARIIRETVGLPWHWTNAPLNLSRELTDGHFTATRRLSAADKAVIRSRLARGTMTDAVIAEMEAKYARSLLNRRALNIARQETITAANHGLRTSWRQARKGGVIPSTSQRVVIVTPDERLRASHAEVPGMNPGGVGLDEPFNTPWGPLMGPPWEADPHLCRCSEGLIFPGLTGAL